MAKQIRTEQKALFDKVFRFEREKDKRIQPRDVLDKIIKEAAKKRRIEG